MLGLQRGVSFLPEPPSAHYVNGHQMGAYEKVEVENGRVGAGWAVGAILPKLTQRKEVARQDFHWRSEFTLRQVMHSATRAMDSLLEHIIHLFILG
jgi:hypothetical protein